MIRLGPVNKAIPLTLNPLPLPHHSTMPFPILLLYILLPPVNQYPVNPVLLSAFRPSWSPVQCVSLNQKFVLRREKREKGENGKKKSKMGGSGLGSKADGSRTREKEKCREVWKCLELQD